MSRAADEPRERRTVADPSDGSRLDGLTGLADRRAFMAALQRALGRRGTDPPAVLVVDLTRFKELNDTLGHAVGDEILHALGPRLQTVASDAELVARLSGDEFGVLLTDPARARPMAEALRAAIEAPFGVRGLQLLVGAHIGIAVGSQGGAARAVLREAALATQSARRMRIGIAAYDPGETHYPGERLALLEQLPRAIATGELILHYQPKFDLGDGRLVGVEALIRWQHPTRGLLYPLSFLPLAEQTGVMRPLTLFVIEESLRQVHRWRCGGLEIPVAVNLAALNLLDVGLPDAVDALLDRFGLPPEYLELEVTERVMDADPDRIAEVLEEFDRRGIKLALDDFGTGSSSLSLLRRLPVSELKIDKSFVRGVAKHDVRDTALVRAMITLAQDLGLDSVAEGIETAEDRDRLAAWGCGQGQGFWLARPLPADAVTELAQGRGVPTRPSGR